MKFTQLGRTGARVSRIALGTMNFGPRVEEKECFRIMDRALEIGINFFDTADRYGNPHGSGQTEEIIGRWLNATRNRDRIVLATKVFGPMGPGANDHGLSAYHIRAACEASLARLQTDRIDLYQMHHVDRGLPHYLSAMEFLGGDLANLVLPAHIRPGAQWEEIWQQMGQLVLQGKVIYVGSSNFAAWNVVQANERAGRRNFMGIVSEQSRYNLLARMVELELLPACRAYGVGFLPYSPLAQGALAGTLMSAEGGRRSGLPNIPETQQKLAAFGELCTEIGQSSATVALAWLLHNPVVTAIVVGPRTIEQLDSALTAIDVELDPQTLSRIEEIFPGPAHANSEQLRSPVYDKLVELHPGGKNQAPEAYAW